MKSIFLRKVEWLKQAELYDTGFAMAHIDTFAANMKGSGIRLSSVPLKINAPEPDQWAYLPPFAPS
jgi:hypothetical protein